MILEFNYPIGFILFCFLLGLAYAILLYFRELKNRDLKKILIIILFTVRAIVISLISLLLLEPVFHHNDKNIEKPIIVIAQDDSESILMNKDSSYYKGDYQDSIHLLINNLQETFDVHQLSYGSSLQSDIRFDFDDKVTGFDNLFDELYARYYGRNLGAIILASDGLLNSGKNPLYSKLKFDNIPIYAIALGDTNIRMDASIQNVLHNRIVLLGNDFPVELHFLANKMQGTKFEVNVYKDGKSLHKKEVIAQKENEVLNINFILNAKEAGKVKYDVTITEIDGELTFQNNHESFYVDVIENEQNILILSNAPHPDIGALKWLLNDRLNSKLDIILLDDFNGQISDYNLIIIHKGFQSSSLYELVNKIKKAKIPILYIIGNELLTDKFNDLNTGIEINNHEGSTDVTSYINKEFSSFTIMKKSQEILETYPPLSIPFASDYKTSHGANVLAYQKINDEFTKYPMIVFNETGELKQGVIIGEGFWRWKMIEFFKHDQASTFKSLFIKTIQYLISNKKKDRFIIDVNDEFNENDIILFYGELYNDNYELVNNTDVEIDLINDSGEVFQKAMLTSGDHYKLAVNRMLPGEYKYIAKTKLGNESFMKKGSFIIKEVKLEYMNSRADHNFLNSLVASYDGIVVNDDQISVIYNSIINREDLVSISHHSTKVDDIIKWKWILFMICLLISIEWLFRKRSGLY